MKLYFVRHGESEANTLRVYSNRGYRYGLTDKGKGQAATLAQNLKDAAISRIFSSPLRRAVETAEILSRAFDVAVEVTGALREYDCGILEEQPYSDVHCGLYHTVQEDWVVRNQWERRIEGGESFLDMKHRFVPFVEALVREYRPDPGNFLLVGHGGLYRCMLPLVLMNIDFRFTLENAINYTSPIIAELRPEGVFCLEWCGMNPQ